MYKFVTMLVLSIVLTGAVAAEPASKSGAEPQNKIRLYEGEGVINLNLQQAELMRISQSADVMVVGDSEIADATLVSDTTLLLTPKAVGSTNLFVLNEDETIILEAKVVVRNEGVKRIKVRKGGTSSTYVCQDGKGCTLVGEENAPASE